MGFSVSSPSYLPASEGLRRCLFTDHGAVSWRLPSSLFSHWQVCVQLGTTVKEEPLMLFRAGHLCSHSVGPVHLGTIVQRVLISQLPAQLGP